jgi:hypothetical protein
MDVRYVLQVISVPLTMLLACGIIILGLEVACS